MDKGRSVRAWVHPVERFWQKRAAGPPIFDLQRSNGKSLARRPSLLRLTYRAIPRAHRLLVGAHVGIWIIVVGQRHDQNQRAAVLLVIEQVRPAISSHAHPTHETESPGITATNAATLFEEHWKKVAAGLQDMPGGIQCRMVGKGNSCPFRKLYPDVLVM
jgi:hypothetical protein